jgi:hypothetical protein
VVNLANPGGQPAWALVGDARHRVAHALPGAPTGRYHDPERIRAEELYSSEAAAIADYDHVAARAGLTAIRLRRKPLLVETELPDGDYVDAYSPARTTTPPSDPAARVIWGTAIGLAGRAGILCPLNRGPGPATAGHAVVVFLHPFAQLPVRGERSL